MLDGIAEKADIDQSTVRLAYAGDKRGLSQIFSIVSREVNKIENSVPFFVITLTGGLAVRGHPAIALITGQVSMLAAASYHQGTHALDAARHTILARLVTPQPPANG